MGSIWFLSFYSCVHLLINFALQCLRLFGCTLLLFRTISSMPFNLGYVLAFDEEMVLIRLSVLFSASLFWLVFLELLVSIGVRTC